MILETNRGIKKMSSIIYDERADHIDTMAKQGKEIERLKAEIERLQFENQHVIWLKHRNEALDKDNKQLRQLLRECRNELQREYTNLGEEDLSLLTKIDEVLK